MSGRISEMAKRGHIWNVRDKANLKRMWIFENIQNTEDKEFQDNDLKEMFLGEQKKVCEREKLYEFFMIQFTFSSSSLSHFTIPSTKWILRSQ